MHSERHNLSGGIRRMPAIAEHSMTGDPVVCRFTRHARLPRHAGLALNDPHILNLSIKAGCSWLLHHLHIHPETMMEVAAQGSMIIIFSPKSLRSISLCGSVPYIKPSITLFYSEI